MESLNGHPVREHKKSLSFKEAFSPEHIAEKTDEFIKTNPRLLTVDRRLVEQNIQMRYIKKASENLKERCRRLETGQKEIAEFEKICVQRDEENAKEIENLTKLIINQPQRQCVIPAFWAWLLSVPGAIYEFAKGLCCF